MKKLSLGIIILQSFLTFSCTNNDLTREEVIAVINKFDEGWRAKDSSLVDEALSPSYIYFTQSGSTFNRANIIHTAHSPEYKLDSVERSGYIVHIRGNTAIVSTIWKGNGRYRGEPFNDTQRCSLTIVKMEGKVEILSEHCTPLGRMIRE
jgi:hypothetical protein